MRRIVLDMQSELFAEAMTKALTDSNIGFMVYTSAKPEDTVAMCLASQANVLLMEVNQQKNWSLDARKRILEELGSSDNGRGCRTLLLVDEKADEILAADVRQAVKDQLVDNFVYTSVSPTYLAGVIDTL